MQELELRIQGDVIVGFYGVYACTVESRDYAPPFVHLALGKSGVGLMCRILTFPCDDHYRPSTATWVRNLYFLWLFGEQNSKKTMK